MARRLITDLRQAERLLNRSLAISGSPVRYLAQGRNGYQAVERFAADDVADGDSDAGRSRWSMRAVLVAGLTIEGATFVLEGMLDAVERVTEGAVITRPDAGAGDFCWSLVETGPTGERVTRIGRTDLEDAYAEREAWIAYHVRQGWTPPGYAEQRHREAVVSLHRGGYGDEQRVTLEIVRDASR